MRRCEHLLRLPSIILRGCCLNLEALIVLLCFNDFVLALEATVFCFFKGTLSLYSCLFLSSIEPFRSLVITRVSEL